MSLMLTSNGRSVEDCRRSCSKRIHNETAHVRGCISTAHADCGTVKHGNFDCGVHGLLESNDDVCFAGDRVCLLLVDGEVFVSEQDVWFI